MLHLLLDTACAPADTMTSQEWSLFLCATIAFPFMGILIGRIWEMKRHKFRIELLTRDLDAAAIEKFEETARRNYLMLSMGAMNDATRGLIPLPRSKEAFEAIWKETEFRYRHWVNESTKEMWADPLSFQNPNAN